MFYKCVDAVIFTEEDLKITTDKKPFIYFLGNFAVSKMSYIFIPKTYSIVFQSIADSIANIRVRDPEAKVSDRPVNSKTLEKVSVSTTFAQSRWVSVSTTSIFLSLYESRSRKL